MRRLVSIVSLTFLLSLTALLAQSPQVPLVATPPMGWNSWDSYSLTITEPQFKDNVQWLDKHLKSFGWQYVVIDEGWYLSNPESGGKPAWQYTLSSNGLYLPAVNRFPSAADGAGFKSLADYVHALGLKFGIHILRGIPREAEDKNLPIAGSPFHAAEAADRSDPCPWNPDNYGVKSGDAGQAYYDSMAKLYAKWELDFVKVDCISQPYKDEEIHMLSRALQNSGRQIVLGLSPGPTPIEKADDARKWAQMFRISGDIWDLWEDGTGANWWAHGVHAQFDLAAAWAKYATPGRWPDLDMLPIGYLGPNTSFGSARQTNLSRDEVRTLFTLWSIARSPLMMGGNLTRTDAFTESLLTNSEVLAVDQQSEGSHQALRTETTAIWLSRPKSGSGYYLAAFNTSNVSQIVTHSWKDLGLEGASFQVRDLWEHKDLGSARRLEVTLKPHSSVLYRLTAPPQDAAQGPGS